MNLSPNRAKVTPATGGSRNPAGSIANLLNARARNAVPGLMACPRGKIPYPIPGSADACIKAANKDRAITDVPQAAANDGNPAGVGTAAPQRVRSLFEEDVS